MDWNGWMQGLAAAAAMTVILWAIGRVLPGLVVRKLREAFEWAKSSAWMRAKPYRVRLLVALLQFLEEELPEPGAGREFYAALGEAVASLPVRWAATWPPVLRGPLRFLAAVMAGSGPKWAALFEKVGDAADTELDAELLELAKAADAPPTP